MTLDKVCRVTWNTKYRKGYYIDVTGNDIKYLQQHWECDSII